QAEDGIRDGHVTGVQTCALPISGPGAVADQRFERTQPRGLSVDRRWLRPDRRADGLAYLVAAAGPKPVAGDDPQRDGRSRRGGRSEERRVGKEGSWRGGRGEFQK